MSDTQQSADTMNQKERSFFYRGVLFFILAGIAYTVLASADPQQYPWAYYLKNFIAVCEAIGIPALIIFVLFRQYRRSSQSNPDKSAREIREAEELRKLHLTSDSWFKMARSAVVIAVVLAVATLAVLLLVRPPNQCPQWHLPDRAHTPLLQMFCFWTMPTLAYAGFLVVRWNWVVQKAIDSVDYPTMAPVTYMLTMMVLMGCVASQVPLAFLVSRCWLGP